MASEGLSFLALAAHIRDQALPIALSRATVVRQNAKVGHVLMTVPPGKAAKLARQIAGISERDQLTARDAANINAAARKRGRKFDRNAARAAR